jgi:hypothetical protein
LLNEAAVYRVGQVGLPRVEDNRSCVSHLPSGEESYAS